MTDWIWLDKAVVLAVHDMQLAEHGGSAGIRDMGALESALSRPVNQANYGDSDIFSLAAAYAYGIARNHPFVDGNKRTAFVALELFLDLNGSQLAASDQDCVLTILSLAAGELSEDALTDWIRQNCAAK